MKKLILFLVVLNLITFGQTAEDYFNKGNSKISLQDYRGAIADYNKCIQLNPDDAAAYNKRGNAKNHLQDKNGACLDWSKAGELGEPQSYIYIKDYCN